MAESMIKKFIYWLYLRVVYLPDLKAKIRKSYPGVRIKCKISDLDKGYVISDEENVRQVQNAQSEREWIPDDKLN